MLSASPLVAWIRSLFYRRGVEGGLSTGKHREAAPSVLVQKGAALHSKEGDMEPEEVELPEAAKQRRQPACISS